MFRCNDSAGAHVTVLVLNANRILVATCEIGERKNWAWLCEKSGDVWQFSVQYVDVCVGSMELEEVIKRNILNGPLHLTEVTPVYIVWEKIKGQKLKVRAEKRVKCRMNVGCLAEKKEYGKRLLDIQNTLLQQKRISMWNDRD